MALAKNSSAYFMHASVPEADQARRKPEHTGSTGTGPALPDAEAVEAATKVQVASWPPGSFDSSADRVTQPDPRSRRVFLGHGEPYSWSGREAVGPFAGLSSLNNNVHAANSRHDPARRRRTLAVRHGCGDLSRHRPARGGDRILPVPARRDLDALGVLRSVDPTPAAPGLNSYAVLPTYPATNYVTDNGPVHLGARGAGQPRQQRHVGVPESAPTRRPAKRHSATVQAGRAVFEKAGCGGCHSGPALTNHRIIPAAEIGTEPTRARPAPRWRRASRPPACSPPTRRSRCPPTGDRPGAARGRHARPGPARLGAGGNRWRLQGSEPRGPRLDGAPTCTIRGSRSSPIRRLSSACRGRSRAVSLPIRRIACAVWVDRDLRAKVVAANKASDTARIARVTGEGTPTGRMPAPVSRAGTRMR